MGCDIHAHVEVKIDNKWEHYNIPDVGRNYALFYLMAGVRGPFDDIIPISEPRGIPNDVSLITKLDCDRWGEDGHSHSYLTCSEVNVVDRWRKEGYHEIWENLFGWLFGNSIGGFLIYPEDYPEFIQDVRVVFWFDN